MKCYRISWDLIVEVFLGFGALCFLDFVSRAAERLELHKILFASLQLLVWLQGLERALVFRV